MSEEISEGYGPEEVIEDPVGPVTITVEGGSSKEEYRIDPPYDKAVKVPGFWEDWLNGDKRAREEFVDLAVGDVFAFWSVLLGAGTIEAYSKLSNFPCLAVISGLATVTSALASKYFIENGTEKLGRYEIPAKKVGVHA